MDYHVFIAPAPGGGYAATCAELPDLDAAADTAEECDVLVMAMVMASLPQDHATLADAFEEVRLVVRYQGVSPDEAAERNWELFLPRHDHNALNPGGF